MPSGSKPISAFADGAPPQAADEYVFERADVTYKVPFLAIQNAIIAAIGPVGAGAPGHTILPDDPEEPEVPLAIPGPRGSDGTPGSIGRDGIAMLPDSPEEPEIPLPIPGTTGPSGSAGATGSAGPAGAPIFPDSPEEPQEPLMIPGPRGATGPAGGGGGGLTLTTAEVNVGSVPKFEGKFILADAAITPSTNLLIFQAPGPYTGKGTLSDESEMDKVTFTAHPGSGQAVVYWRVQTQLGWKRYGEGGKRNAVVMPDLDDTETQFVPCTVGKIRGNIKYSYAVSA